MAKGLRIAITGANGRLGKSLVQNYAERHEVIALTRAEFDLGNHLERMRSALDRLDFDILVNTAGSTNVDKCEDDPREAAVVNTDAPHIMAEICRQKGARLIHVSTDYVFAGDDPAPRTETDTTEPICIYGQTKLAGEQAVLSVSPGFLVLRVSWLFGPHKDAFPDLIIKRAMESDHVEAIADKHSCPTYSEDLAKWIEPLLDNPLAHGLLHLCNSGATSWQAYGQTVLDLAVKAGFKLRTNVVHPISRLSFPGFKAARPEFTAFDTSKFTKLTGIAPRPWWDALEEYLRKKFAAL